MEPDEQANIEEQEKEAEQKEPSRKEVLAAKLERIEEQLDAITIECTIDDAKIAEIKAHKQLCIAKKIRMQISYSIAHKELDKIKGSEKQVFVDRMQKALERLSKIEDTLKDDSGSNSESEQDSASCEGCDTCPGIPEDTQSSPNQADPTEL